MIKSKFSGLVAIRYVGHGSAKPFVANIHPKDLCKEMNELLRHGWRENQFQIVEQCTPDIVRYLINAEITRTEAGLFLYCSFENDFMRPSLEKGGQNFVNLQAQYILREKVPPVELEDLMELLDLPLEGKS